MNEEVKDTQEKEERGFFARLLIQTTWAIALVFVSIFIKEPLERFLRQLPIAEKVESYFESQRILHAADFRKAYDGAKDAKLTATRLLRTASECRMVQGKKGELLVGLAVELNNVKEKKKAFDDAMKVTSALSPEEEKSFYNFSSAIEFVVEAVKSEFASNSVADGITFEAHRLYLDKVFATVEFMRLLLDQDNS